MEVINTAVIFGTGPTALGAMWDARKAGLDVIHVTAKENDTAALSRVPRYSVCVPQTSDEEQVDVLLKLDAPANQTILWATNDDQVELVSRHHAALSTRFFIPLTPWQHLEHTVDKLKLCALAHRHQIPAPWILQAETVIDGTTEPPAYPCLIKPTQTPRFFAHYNTKLHTAQTHQQAIDLCKDAQANDIEVMACEYIRGDTSDLKLMNIYRDQKGEYRFALLAEKVRTHPLKFGLGAVIRTIPMDAELLELSKKLLQANHYHGFAMIEWKQDPGTKTYTLIEINPRPVLFQRLFQHAGINYFDAITADAENRKINDKTYQSGQYWIQNFSDYQTLKELRLQKGFTYRQFFAPYFKNPVHAFPLFADPKPFCSLLKKHVLRKFKRLFGLTAEPIESS